MQHILSFIKGNNMLAMVVAVLLGVFFVVGVVESATTISTNITTAGTVTVGVDDTGADVTFYGATSGSYWLWDESADTMIIKAGVASTSAIKVGDESDATTINGMVVGYCTFPTVTITASSTGMASCAGATGVVSGDRIFVQATSSLPDVFVIQAASSTAAGVIQVDIVNLGFTVTTATGVNSLNFWAVR